MSQPGSPGRLMISFTREGSEGSAALGCVISAVMRVCRFGSESIQNRNVTTRAGSVRDGPARCWAMAYGIMVGTEWPDDIPADYQEKYGMKLLRDTDVPTVQDSIRQEARRFAEVSVERAKQLIFPVHKLS